MKVRGERGRGRSRGRDVGVDEHKGRVWSVVGNDLD